MDNIDYVNSKNITDILTSHQNANQTEDSIKLAKQISRSVQRSFDENDQMFLILKTITEKNPQELPRLMVALAVGIGIGIKLEQKNKSETKVISC